MTTLWPLLRAWMARLNPRMRRALDKRKLETVCRQFGCSRSQAVQIAREFFR